MLLLPCHHGTPHQCTLLGSNGILGIPFFTMTCLNLHEIQLFILLRNDVYFLMLMPPIARKNLVAVLQKIVGRYILTPLSKIVMPRHIDVLAGCYLEAVGKNGGFVT